MLIILSSIYAGVIWLVFLKFKLLPWNKVSQSLAAGVGVAGLLAVLIGMGMGSPTASGGVMIQADVTRLAVHKFGYVTKVHAEINAPLKKGEPIFEIDKTLYEAGVRAAEAALAQAAYGVEQLEATWKQSQANVLVLEAEQRVLASTIAGAAANVKSADAGLAAGKSAVASATANVQKATVDVEIGQVQHGRIQELVEQNVESQSELDKATRTIEARKAALVSAKALEQKAGEDVDRLEAQLEGAQASEQQARRSQASLQAQLEGAQAGEQKARAAAEIGREGDHTTVRLAREQLVSAKYDLENCVVRAPTNGYVVALGLTEGNYVRMTQVGTFVSTERYWALAFFAQNTVRNIRPGQEAEFALRQYPGRILEGTVDSVTHAAGESQMLVSGQIPAINTLTVPLRNAVRFRVDGFPEDAPPRFAASGDVAVYTESAKPIHIVRKIVLRMTSIMNWIPR